eukprot:7927987-Ditylum_brightwellii.AAC.1
MLGEKENDAVDSLCKVTTLNEKLGENEKAVEDLEKRGADLTEENERALKKISERENKATGFLCKVKTLNDKLAEIEKTVKDLEKRLADLAEENEQALKI